MVDRNLIESLGVSDDDVQQQIETALGPEQDQQPLGELLRSDAQHRPDTILTGRTYGRRAHLIIHQILSD